MNSEEPQRKQLVPAAQHKVNHYHPKPKADSRSTSARSGNPTFTFQEILGSKPVADGTPDFQAEFCSCKWCGAYHFVMSLVRSRSCPQAQPRCICVTCLFIHYRNARSYNGAYSKFNSISSSWCSARCCLCRCYGCVRERKILQSLMLRYRSRRSSQ